MKRSDPSQRKESHRARAQAMRGAGLVFEWAGRRKAFEIAGRARRQGFAVIPGGALDFLRRFWVFLIQNQGGRRPGGSAIGFLKYSGI